MKAKRSAEQVQIWWMMVHALDFISFSFLDNLEETEELEKAKQAYYDLMELSNMYVKRIKED